jgi:hypothetical protein
MYYNNYTLRTPYSNELYHHGIKGQKWGVRRYQNPDGSLTEAGQKRYNKGVKILEKKYKREYMRDTRKERLSELKNSTRDNDGTYSDKELDKILNRQYKDAEKYVKDKMSKVTMEDAMKAYSTHQKKVAATVAAASAITLTAGVAMYKRDTGKLKPALKEENDWYWNHADAIQRELNAEKAYKSAINYNKLRNTEASESELKRAKRNLEYAKTQRQTIQSLHDSSAGLTDSLIDIPNTEYGKNMRKKYIRKSRSKFNRNSVRKWWG